MSILLVLGKNIVEQRKKMGLSQKDFAEKLGITQDALSRIEKGKMAPKMTRLESFAKLFKCSVSTLFLTDFEKQNFQGRIITDCLERLSPQGRAALVELIERAVDIMTLDFSTCEGTEKPVETGRSCPECNKN